MKKKYVEPEVEIVLIDEADIIFASGGSPSCYDCDEYCTNGSSE